MLASGSHSSLQFLKFCSAGFGEPSWSQIATKREVAKYTSMRFNDQLGRLAADWIDQSRLLIFKSFRAGVIMIYENGRQLVQSNWR
jgi:hypothetical protein